MTKEQFKNWCNAQRAKGINGSFSVKTGEQNDTAKFLFDGPASDKSIHEKVYDLDIEYACVIVAHEGDNKLDSHGNLLPSLSENDSLEDAVITEGIGHTHGYIIKENGLVVRYSYTLEI